MEYRKIEEQEIVLETQGKNQLISASAGSGKTSVMIKKIYNQISAKTPIKKILVLTYTKAAASEMKQRLENMLTENANDEFAIQQLNDLSVADICTFHAFCQKLIKKFFYALNINPAFSILDESTCNNLKDECFEKALEEFADKKLDAASQLFEVFAVNRTNKRLKSIVFQISDYKQSVDNSTWYKNINNLFQGDIAEKMLNSNLTEKVLIIKKSLEELMQQASDFGFSSYVKNINETLSQISGIKLGNSFAQNLEVISSYKTVVLREDKSDEIEFKNKIADVKKQLKTCFDSELDKNYGTSEDIANSYLFCQQTALNLLELEELYNKIYTEIKSNKNFMDYSDLEKNALKILHDEILQTKIKSLYERIFIDEFQDANEIQEEIINLIARENNKFMVGDVKQSIYGFRQSNPDIFLKIEKEYKTDSNSVAQLLNSNFRSDKDILEFVNNIFVVLMTERTAGINYLKNAKLHAQCDFKKDGLPAVEILVVKKQKKEVEKLKGVYSVKNHKIDEEISFATSEAEIVASKIQKVLNTKIYDNKLEKFREVRFSDIAILIRGRGNYLNTFSKTLIDLGLPLAINSEQNVLLVREGQLFKNVLKLINNDKDDFALINVMLSEFSNFNEDELSQIRLAFPKEKYFYDAIKLYSNQFFDEISQKIINFYDLISKIRFNLEINNIYSALNLLYKEANLKEKLLFTLNGAKKLKIYDSLKNYFLNKDISIADFIVNEDIEIRISNSISSSDNILLTTMHASKGLEFPIVFCVNMGSEFSHERKNNELMLSKNFGLATKYFDLQNHVEHSSIFMEAIKLKNNENDFAEKLRLLYVALTRAQNHLYIVGSTDKDSFQQINNDYDTRNASSYLNLIIGTFPAKILENINDVENQVLDEQVVFSYIKNLEIHEILKIDATNILEKESTEASDLFNYINYVYPHENQTKIALKNSVSELVGENLFASSNYTPLNMSLSEHNSNIAKNKIGIAYHKIFELFDFQKDFTLEELVDFVNDLFARGVLESELIFEINIKLIYDNLLTLKALAMNSKIVKEKNFIMKVPYCSVCDSAITQKIMVQGVIDLQIIGDKNFIVDYKLTNISSEEKLKEKYFKQLFLYKKALESAMAIKVDECYILNINKNKLVKLINK